VHRVFAMEAVHSGMLASRLQWCSQFDACQVDGSTAHSYRSASGGLQVYRFLSVWKSVVDAHVCVINAVSACVC
jgi:hypothetical protein